MVILLRISIVFELIERSTCPGICDKMCFFSPMGGIFRLRLVHQIDVSRSSDGVRQSFGVENMSRDRDLSFGKIMNAKYSQTKKL